MATQSELNNVEAFLLALGRPMDPDISSMDLTDSQANQGLQIFSNGPCNTCHGNAGAINAFGVNGLIDTGVENDPAARRRRARFDIPRDGGFGAGDGTEDIGDGRFNVPPVIEAADTPPFFHNSARLRSIEEAVRFYSAAAFNNSPGADLTGRINLSNSQSNQVAAFLRVINALENIRTVIEMLDTAIEALEQNRRGVSIRRRLIRTQADADDAQDVLRAKNLNRNAIGDIRQAINDIRAARRTRRVSRIIGKMEEAIASLEVAREKICPSGDSMLCAN